MVLCFQIIFMQILCTVIVQIIELLLFNLCLFFFLLLIFIAVWHFLWGLLWNLLGVLFTVIFFIAFHAVLVFRNARAYFWKDLFFILVLKRRSPITTSVAIPIVFFKHTLAFDSFQSSFVFVKMWISLSLSTFDKGWKIQWVFLSNLVFMGDFGCRYTCRLMESPNFVNFFKSTRFRGQLIEKKLVLFTKARILLAKFFILSP